MISKLSGAVKRSFSAVRSMWPWLPTDKTSRSLRAQSMHAKHREYMPSNLPNGAFLLTTHLRTWTLSNSSEIGASIVGPTTGTSGLDAKGLILQSTDAGSAAHVLRVGQQV